MLPTQKNIEYRTDIDGLRAIAILAVMIYHGFPKSLPGGFIGVDIFFVISGYLISNIILQQVSDGTFSIAGFYYRRARRILPALILVLSYCAIIGWLLQMPWELEALGKSMIAGIFFLSNIMFWQEVGYFDTASQEKPLLHLWSLGIEEQFYIFWPIILLILLYKRWNAMLITISMMVISWLISSYLINKNLHATAFFLPVSRAGELCMGALLALMQNGPDGLLKTWPAARRHKLSLAGFLILLASIAWLRGGRHFPGLWTLLPTMGTAMLIAAGPNGVINRYLLSRKLLVGVGLISYPLYLWHWPLLTLPNPFGLQSAPSIRNTMIPLSFVLAWATYRFIEKPVRHLPLNTRNVCSIVLPALLVAATGLLFFINHGYPNRYPEEIKAIVKLEKNRVFPYQPTNKNRACQTKANFSICRDNNNPDILLWGDSHAGAFYRGLDKQPTRKTMSITLAEGCVTPPFISPIPYSDEWCDTPVQRFSNSLRTIDYIQQTQPKMVILHARWAYDHYRLTPEGTMDELRKTAQAIKARAPTAEIVILGPVPNWSRSLAQSMFNYWKQTPGHPLPPPFMRFGLDEKIAGWDKKMAAIAQQTGLHYISAYQLMCNKAGCLTRVGPAATDITAIDYGHLSPVGAQYLAGKVMPQLDQLTHNP